MRQNTNVWIRIANVGRPADTLKRQVTIREATMTIAHWLLQVYMKERIVITIARTEAELERKQGVDLEILGDLESLMDASPEPDTYQTCNDRGCAMSYEHRLGEVGCRHEPDTDTDTAESQNENDLRVVCPHGTRFTLQCLDCEREHQEATR